MSNLREKSIKSIFWVGSTRILQQSFSWFATIFLVRILSPADFGIMGMLMAYQALIILLYDLSLGEAIIQKIDLTEEDTNTCFWFTFCFGLILTSITWLAAPSIAIFFRNEQLIWMLRISGIGILCLSVKEVHTVLLRRNLDFEKRSKAQLYAGIIQLVISLCLAILGFGVWSLVLGLFANHFFHTLFTLYYTRWKPIAFFSWKRLKDIFKFALPLVGTNILWFLTNRSDSVIIGRFFGADILGFYRVAMDLSRIPIDKLIKIINEVSFPVFSKLQKDIEGLNSYFLKTIKYISLLTFPMFIGMILVSKEIVYIILTPKWLPIINLLRIFCIVSIIQSQVGIFIITLKSIGRVKTIFKFSLFSSILMPLSILFAIPFGITIVACTWLFIYPGLFIYLFIMTAKLLNISYKTILKIFSPIFMANTIMAISVTFAKITSPFDIGSLYGLIYYILIGILSYTLFFIVFYYNTVNELRGIILTAFSRNVD